MFERFTESGIYVKVAPFKYGVRIFVRFKQNNGLLLKFFYYCGSVFYVRMKLVEQLFARDKTGLAVKKIYHSYTFQNIYMLFGKATRLYFLNRVSGDMPYFRFA